MARPRSKRDQGRIDLLRSTYGVDLLEGHVTGTEPAAQLAGMVQRVRHRSWLRRLGLPVAPLHENGTCVVCGTETSEKKRAHPDTPEFLAWRGEWVEVHQRCRHALKPSVGIVERRGGACFVLSQF